MAPSWGHPPLAVISVKVMVGEVSQLSVAVAVPVLAGNVLAVHCMVTFEGQVIVGIPVSITSMDCRHVLVLPQPSVADHVRLIVLNNGQIPATVTSLNVMIGLAIQLSVAVADPVFAGNVLSVHWIVTSPGQTITGGVVSSTLIN